ncbi:MAG: hypothetical protein JSS53_09020 [Proteobacteria bacterium]|nr:hypothetical protein [Pseudomonadota bacterium]
MAIQLGFFPKPVEEVPHSQDSQVYFSHNSQGKSQIAPMGSGKSKELEDLLKLYCTDSIDNTIA